MRGRTLKYIFLVFISMLCACNSDNFDWRKTFESNSTEPIGTFILRKELPKIFQNSEITDIKTNTYDFFYYQSPETGNYFYIQTDTYFLQADAWREILGFVNNGGNAFLSAYAFGTELTDSLGFEVKNQGMLQRNQSIQLTVTLPDNQKSYVFDGQSKNLTYFSSFNERTTEILGHVEMNGEKKPNFIKIYYGKGSLLLHTEPVAFSNYEMLQKDHFEYVTHLFSYIDDQHIYWDNFRTDRRNESNNKGYDNGGFFSSLSFIMKNNSLRTAFFILLFLGLSYLLLNSKRRQRPQKVIRPYANYTLDFTKTLAELYRNSTDHSALVKYKINYFLEQLRLHYNITAKDTEKDFSELLSAKSGVDIEICRNLAQRINQYRTREYLNQNDFDTICAAIASFNRKIKFNGRKS